jgi:hypothetical protein
MRNPQDKGWKFINVFNNILVLGFQTLPKNAWTIYIFKKMSEITPHVTVFCIYCTVRLNMFHYN